MKRTIFILLCFFLLSGCASLAPEEYYAVTPHQDSSVQPAPADAITVKDYQSLKHAIWSQVHAGQTEGVIHVTNYDGVVEDDLRSAAYEVSKLDPLGAYAVDYMTHTCTRIVSYYEVRVSITFRRTAREIAQIQSVTTQEQLQERLERALDNGHSRLTVRVTGYAQQDQEIPALAEAYCAANVSRIMETPDVSISVYPETGNVRILEINFLYTNTPQTLLDKKDAVEESIHAAVEYIRYREGDYDKAQLLYSYLIQRFQYQQAETVTPLYDALCGGIADPAGLAQAWQLICDRAGMECYTVTGLRNGEPYTWNILRAGSYYRHLDLAKCVLEGSGLVLRSDPEMGSYYWNTELLPACEFVYEPAPEESPAEDETPSIEEALPPEELPEAPTEEETEVLPQS